MRSILIFALLFSAMAQAQVYKWTDENGVTHFGAQPPAGQQEEVTIRESKTGSMGSGGPTDSDLMRRSREMERQRQMDSADRRYSQNRSDSGERPDYVCQGAENRLQSAIDRWDNLRRQGYTISEEERYTQRIRDARRHRDNICR